MKTEVKKRKKTVKAKTQKKKGPASTGRKPLCLVTGACGFIGSHMVEVLHQKGHRIRATDLAEAYARDDRERGRFPSVMKDLGVEFIPSDVTRPETLKEVTRGVSYVFHIAAVFSYSAPWEVLKRVNVEGTRSLCSVLSGKKTFKKLILWGAGGVYGFPSSTAFPIREEDPKAPPNDYLKSKHEEEQLVMEVGRETGLRYSIVRPTGVYGPRGVYGMGRMILPFAKMKRLFIPRNFTSRVPLVHVRDVCGAALFLAGKKGTDGEAYNLNDDTQMTMVDYMRYMGVLLGKPVTVLPPVPIGIMKNLLNRLAAVEALVSKVLVNRPRMLEPDTIQYLGVDLTYSNEKLKNAGYRFLYPDARTGLLETVDWYRRNGWMEPRG